MVTLVFLRCSCLAILLEWVLLLNSPSPNLFFFFFFASSFVWQLVISVSLGIFKIYKLLFRTITLNDLQTFYVI